MDTLVIVEHNNKNMHPSVRQVLTAALQFDDKPVLLVIGHDCQQVVNNVATLAGVKEVWVADHPCYEHFLAENSSQLLFHLSSSFSRIMVAATTFGKNLLPRVAALLDVVQVSDVTRIINRDTFEHPIYAGNAMETVRVLDDKKLLTIRPSAFDEVTDTQLPCIIKNLTTIFEAKRVTFIEQMLTKMTRPELGQASIVVAGGRGLQSAAQFKLIEALADALGAAVGASRAAVDAGFVPNDYQVGQTGKVVAPTLYFAIGISGAVQHVAGMKDSKIIVAINKDADAPIFQIATYGLVGDLFTIVPELINKLTQS